MVGSRRRFPPNVAHISGRDSTRGSTTRRIGIVQTVIPQYRVPVFNRLNAEPRLDLIVIADTRDRPGAPAPGTGATFSVEHAPEWHCGPAVFQSAMVRAIRSRRFDVMILPWNSRYAQLGHALRIAKKQGVRTILWGHGFSRHETSLRRRLRNRLLRFADGCLLYSQSAADRLMSEGYDSRRIFVAPNAIDQAPIRAATKQWQEYPDQLRNFARERDIVPGRLVVFVSRLEPDKHVDRLIAAFAIVATKDPDARLAIIGDGSCRDALETDVATRGLRNVVHFPGAIYEEQTLAPWCLSAGVVAYPQAIGLSILHAFGYGLPVVTSDHLAGHNPEISALNAGGNGLFYADGNVGDFAKKILAIIGNPHLSQRMSGQSLDAVTGDFGYTIERMVTGIVDAIDGVSSTNEENLEAQTRTRRSGRLVTNRQDSLQLPAGSE